MARPSREHRPKPDLVVDQRRGDVDGDLIKPAHDAVRATDGCRPPGLASPRHRAEVHTTRRPQHDVTVMAGVLVAAIVVATVVVATVVVATVVIAAIVNAAIVIAAIVIAAIVIAAIVIAAMVMAAGVMAAVVCHRGRAQGDGAARQRQHVVDRKVKMDAAAIAHRLNLEPRVTGRRQQRRELIVPSAPCRQARARHRRPELAGIVELSHRPIDERIHPADHGRPLPIHCLLLSNSDISLSATRW